jgi:2-furoyl-CoA dehydrogenase large subunit
MLRVEDDALLRGEGRFLDDLVPVARTFHAAVVRSQLAHARIEVDATAALALPGVVGVLTGADVARLSRPFPAGIESGMPQYAAAIDTVRYVGEPIAVVVARDRYLAEDAAEIVEVDYDPLDAVLDPAAAAADAVHDRSFSYGDVDGAMAGAELVLRQTFHFPRFTCTPVECYAVVAEWEATAGRLTAWANFQGPFTLHGVAAAALGLKGDRLRLLTPPDSGGSFGIKSSVFAYVVLMGLAARHLGVPVTWTEDRLEHLAASAAATGRTTEVEAGFAADGRLLALRYDAIEDVGAYVRAPEPATLYRMHGSLSGAYTVPNVAVRNRVVLTNTIPSGLNRGFGGPQLYLGLERTMAIAARRLGLDPAELARRNLIPATTRPVSTRRSSWPTTARSAHGSPRSERTVASPGSGSRASSSPRSRTWATSRSRRPRTSVRSSCPSRAMPREPRL